MKKLINTTALKELAGNMRLSKDLPDALDLKIRKDFEDAISRATANNRKTVFPTDL